MTRGRHENDGQGGPVSPASGPVPLDGRIESWRIQLDHRALPLPTLRPITIGSDGRAGIQLGHGSVRPLHVQLSKKGPAIHLVALDPAGEVFVNGKPVREAHLLGGEEIRVGVIPMRVERSQVDAKVRAGQAPPLPLHREFEVALRRELARAPWLLLSLAFHVLLLLLARNLFDDRRAEPDEHWILAEIDDRSNAMPAVEAPPMDDRAPEMDDEPRDLPEPMMDEPTDVEEALAEPEAADLVGLGDLSRVAGDIGAVRVRNGLGSGGGVSIGTLSGPLRARLEEFRSRGLDLVFLVDTTSSMEPFLNQAKAECDRIITDLAALIPNMTLGVIAYRDHGEAYVTRAMPLGDDRYAILNFLESLEPAGGGDAPEAVLDAVQYGLDSLQWRPEANRVMLLVADAPPHPEDMAKLRMRLGSATRSTRAETVLSVIYTGRSFGGEDTERALREVAAAGKGEFARLDEGGQIVSQIIGLTLGSQYRNSAQLLLTQRRDSPREVLVQNKVRERDVDWLVKKMRLFPVEPSIVHGLIQLRSPAVAMRCMDIVTDPRTLRPSKEAALYVLRRTVRYSGALDFDRALTAQADEIKALRRALEKTYR